MQETWIRSLAWEDPLEEGMATHSRILAWRIPVDRGPWRATIHGVTESWIQLSNYRVAFEEGSGPRVLLKSGPGQRGRELARALSRSVL